MATTETTADRAPKWKWIHNIEARSLTLAQVLLAIVSGITTYKGFLLLLQPWPLAAFATLGVQSLVFWIPRRLHLHRGLRAVALDSLLFVFSAAISVLFSYQAFVEELVPRELREQRTTRSAFVVAQQYASDSAALAGSLVSAFELKARDFEAKAKQEEDEGGTAPGSRRGGKGRHYREWRNKARDAAVVKEGLAVFQKDLTNILSDIADLEKDDRSTSERLHLLQGFVQKIAAINNNRVILDHLEQANIAEQPASVKTPPRIDQAGLADGSPVAVKDRFLEGLNYMHVALTQDLATAQLRELGWGVVVALSLAILLDLLILALGWAGSLPNKEGLRMACLRLLGREAGSSPSAALPISRFGSEIGIAVSATSEQLTDLRPSQQLDAQLLTVNKLLAVTETEGGKVRLVFKSRMMSLIFGND